MINKVIFRKDKSTNEIMGFIPQLDVNWGKIVGYAHEGQHFEADILYYEQQTVGAKREEYQSLLNEMQSIYDNSLEIRQKLYRRDLSWANN